MYTNKERWETKFCDVRTLFSNKTLPIDLNKFLAGKG